MREWSISSRETVPTEHGPGKACRETLADDLPLAGADRHKENNDSA